MLFNPFNFLKLRQTGKILNRCQPQNYLFETDLNVLELFPEGSSLELQDRPVTQKFQLID